MEEEAHKSNVLGPQVIPLATDELSQINARSVCCDETLPGLIQDNDLKAALRQTVAMRIKHCTKNNVQLPENSENPLLVEQDCGDILDACECSNPTRKKPIAYRKRMVNTSAASFEGTLGQHACATVNLGDVSKTK